LTGPLWELAGRPPLWEEWSGSWELGLAADEESRCTHGRLSCTRSRGFDSHSESFVWKMKMKKKKKERKERKERRKRSNREATIISAVGPVSA